MFDWAMLEAMREVDEMTPDAPRLSPLEYSHVRTAAEFQAHVERRSCQDNSGVALMLLANSQAAQSDAHWRAMANQQQSTTLAYIALAGRGS